MENRLKNFKCPCCGLEYGVFGTEYGAVKDCRVYIASKNDNGSYECGACESEFLLDGSFPDGTKILKRTKYPVRDLSNEIIEKAIDENLIPKAVRVYYEDGKDIVGYRDQGAWFEEYNKVDLREILRLASIAKSLGIEDALKEYQEALGNKIAFELKDENSEKSQGNGEPQGPQ